MVLILQIFEKLQDKTISIDMFSQHELHPSSSDPSAADWIFVVDTLNFCFWSPDAAHYSVSHNGKRYTGYFALCAALNRAQVLCPRMEMICDVTESIPFLIHL